MVQREVYLWKDQKSPTPILNNKKEVFQVGPSSAAFSPNGRQLYLAGYSWADGEYRFGVNCLSGVAVLDFKGNESPKTFVGSLEQDINGSAEKEFNCATSVAVDKQGRVYVSDYMNNRIQIFSPEGVFLKAVSVHRPAIVNIHPKTQELYIFSWFFNTQELDKLGSKNDKLKVKTEDIPSRLYKFGPFENPKKLAEYELPFLPQRAGAVSGGTYPLSLLGVRFWGALDGYGDKTTIWLGQGRGGRGGGYIDAFEGNDWDAFGIQILTEENGKLTMLKDFGKDTKASVQRTKPPRAHSGPNQMLYVNPTNGMLYLWEGDSGCLAKNCQELLEIDPESGAIRKIQLPFSAMDISFGIDGLLYLRTTDILGRYDAKTLKEVPFDYGVELDNFSGLENIKGQHPINGGMLASAVKMPMMGVVCYFQGGMGVSQFGDIAVAGGNRPGTIVDGLKSGHAQAKIFSKPWSPQLYAGRQSSSTSCCIHVWDKYGKLKHEDAIPGLPQLDGVQIDREGNIYVMACATRLLDGKKEYNPATSTLIKFKPKVGKIISLNKTCPVPLPKSEEPAGPPQLEGNNWVKNADWFYGGVGFDSMGYTGCQCWRWARFTLDLYARSFAPEPDLYSFAVIDTNGNLIMRIGKYGNIDDGKPLVAAGGPPHPRSIGGDEVALFSAMFVATHTDRRLFLADAGNHRLLSIKLDYHVEEKVAFVGIRESVK